MQNRSLARYVVTTPEIEGPKEFSQLLFGDLVENHYPTLQNQSKRYVEKSEDLKKKEERRDEKAIEILEGELKRGGFQYERDPGKISKEKIIYSGGLATRLLYFMRHRERMKDPGTNVARADSGYEVRAGGNRLYFTDNEGEAEKVKVQLNRIVLDCADNEELKLMLKEYNKAGREKKEEREKLITYLGMLREKTKLKVIRERPLGRPKCPHIKPEMNVK